MDKIKHVFVTNNESTDATFCKICGKHYMDKIHYEYHEFYGQEWKSGEI